MRAGRFSVQDLYKIWSRFLRFLLMLSLLGSGTFTHADVFLPQLPKQEASEAKPSENETPPPEDTSPSTESRTTSSSKNMTFSQDPIDSLKILGDSLWILGRRNLYRAKGNGNPEIVKKGIRAKDVNTIQGNIYIGATDGLYSSAITDLESLEDADPELLIPITSLAVFDNLLWIGTERGLFLLDEDGPVLSIQVLGLQVTSDSLWILAPQNIFLLSRPPHGFNQSAPADWPLESLRVDDPPVSFKAIELLSDSIWITSIRHLKLGHPGAPYLVLQDNVSTPAGMEDWKVSSIKQACDGNLLFSRKAGLEIIEASGSPLHSFATKDPVRFAFDWDHHKWWLGTPKFLRTVAGLGSEPQVSTAGGLLRINDAVTHHNSLWLATEQGAFKLEEEVELLGRTKGIDIKFERKLFDFTADYAGEVKGLQPLPPESIEVLTKGLAEKDTALSPERIDEFKSTAEQIPDMLFIGSNSNSFRVHDEFGNFSKIQRYQIFVFPEFWIICVFVISLYLVSNRPHKMSAFNPKQEDPQND